MITEEIRRDLRPTSSNEKGSVPPPHTTAEAVVNDAQKFSLVLGGPLYQLLRRAHLADDALLMVRQRVVVIALLAWLPLLILSAVQGHLWGNSVAVPFLFDLEVHIRFLVVVPLLVIAELVAHQRLRVQQQSVIVCKNDTRAFHGFSIKRQMTVALASNGQYCCRY